MINLNRVSSAIIGQTNTSEVSVKGMLLKFSKFHPATLVNKCGYLLIKSNKLLMAGDAISNHLKRLITVFINIW